MEIFSQWMGMLAAVPDWVALAVIPAASLPAAVCLALTGKRRLYAPVACGLSVCGTALVAARGEVAVSLVYLAGTCALQLLFALFLLLPPVRRRQRESREERIYRKFHEELEDPQTDGMPPKVCSYEGTATAEESGMRLVYAATLIAKLKNCKLTPADRLELEALGRAVEGCRGKALTGGELGSLNDALAAILKLTAKYKL